MKRLEREAERRPSLLVTEILLKCGIFMSERGEHISQLLDVAEEVRDFYDRYPYPRPIDSLEKYRQLWQDEP